MRKLAMLLWCGISALAAYPLVMLARTWFAIGSVEPRWFSASFAVSALLGLFVLPRRFSPIRARSPEAAVLAVAVWVVTSHGLWLSFHFLAGTAAAIDFWLPVATASALGMLAFVGVFASTLFSDGGKTLPLLAIIAGTALVASVALALGEAGSALLGLFVFTELVTYYLLIWRRRPSLADLPLYVRAAAQWIVAAHLAWITALFADGVLSDVPRFLPLATATIQIALSVVLPIALTVTRDGLSLHRLACDPLSLELPAARIEVVRGPRTGERTAWIISYTGVSNEPRVIRQSRALLDAGWRVVVCGFDGHSPRPPEWTYIRLPSSDAFRAKVLRVLRVVRKIAYALSFVAEPKALRRRAPLVFHWCIPNWLHLRRSLLATARAHPDLAPELVIANDYYTCDTGYAVARLFGAKFVVDCHEYAVEQDPRDPNGARWHQRYIAAVQDYYLVGADLVTTVSEGIARLLDADHKLRRPVLVIRSIPFAQPQPFRPTGQRIKVLYHGGLWAVRQLHTAIESMPLWRPEFDLVLRGDGDADYLAQLRLRAQGLGVAHRVFIEPAVPFDRIIPEANQADIGYFSYANFSRQSEFVLPNKFFEYVMAGLAVCVVDLSEMGRLTRRYQLGKLIPHHSPAVIAETINSFTRDEIDRCKKASLAAAQELNWDHERQRLLAACDELFGATVGAERMGRSAAAATMQATV
jgi:hypothetical protein